MSLSYAKAQDCQLGRYMQCCDKLLIDYSENDREFVTGFTVCQICGTSYRNGAVFADFNTERVRETVAELKHTINVPQKEQS